MKNTIWNLINTEAEVGIDLIFASPNNIFLTLRELKNSLTDKFPVEYVSYSFDWSIG